MKTSVNSFMFSALHMLTNKKDLKYYHQLMNNANKSFEELQFEQDMHLRAIIDYAFKYVPYYKKQFKQLGMIPSDIKQKKDLELLPVINKATIRENFNDFISEDTSVNYVIGSTGGSTGEPLKYRMSTKDKALGFALNYRGWGYGGYLPGMSMLILGGGSIVARELTLRKKIFHRIKNHYIASSYGMDDVYMNHLISIISKNKIKFIRGYSSSIYLLADFIKTNSTDRKKVDSVQSIFTTAEMLYPQQRKIIEEAFDAKVFNGYGLNDGGITAFENGTTEGFLIDTERSVMECVDDNGNQISGIPGRIIATNLFNYPMPFIRYETGDMGIITEDYIKTGGNRYLLKNLLGRTTDYLILNGKKIGSPVLTVVMGKINAKRYQFIQKDSNSIEVNIDKDDNYSTTDENFIRDSIISHVGQCNITFNYNTRFQSTGNKNKFIIRDI